MIICNINKALLRVYSGYNEEFQTFPDTKKTTKVLELLLQKRKIGDITQVCHLKKKKQAVKE